MCQLQPRPRSIHDLPQRGEVEGDVQRVGERYPVEHRSRGRVLVICQVVLSFGIPFALIPLLIFCRNLMGVLVNHRLTTAMATVVVALIISLNVVLLYRTFFS